MHDHTELTEHSYLVTLMSTELEVHQIQVNSPCTCDMWSWVNELDLPIVPAFMSIEDLVDLEPERVPSD